VSNDIQPHDVAEATRWLKMSKGIEKGTDAMTVNRGLDLAAKGEKRGNPCRTFNEIIQGLLGDGKPFRHAMIA